MSTDIRRIGLAGRPVGGWISIWCRLLLSSLAFNQTLSAADECLEEWRRPGLPIPVSIRPNFNCLDSVRGKSVRRSVTWNIDDRPPVGLQLLATPKGPYATAHSDGNNTVILSWNKTLPADKSFVLSITQATSQGLTSLPIDVTYSLGSLTVPFGQPAYRLALTPFLSSHLVQFLLDWGPQLMSDVGGGGHTDDGSSVQDVVLVYNTTHILQKTMSSRSLCLNDLRPAGRYEFCVQPEKNTCHGPWTCITRIIPASEETSFNGERIPFGIRNLTVVGLGNDWLQLSWLPPQRSLADARHWSTRAYLVSVEPDSASTSIPCQSLTYYVQAPWSESDDAKALEAAIEKARRERIRAGCPADKRPVKLETLGAWPDWERPDELLDEFGPIGELTVTLEKLQSNQSYEVTVTPVMSATGHFRVVPSRLTVLTAASPCQVIDAGSGGYRVVWRGTQQGPTGNNDPDTNGVQAQFSAFQVDRPSSPMVNTDGKVCNATTFRVYFEPRPLGASQRLHLFTSDLRYSSPEGQEFLPTDCLTQCHLYDLVVRVLGPDGGEGGWCARRVALLPQPTPVELASSPEETVNVTRLASNYLLVRVRLDTAERRSACPPVGHVITATSADGWRSNPLLLMATDGLASRLPPVYPMPTVTPSDRRPSAFTLLVPNPNPSVEELWVRLEILAVGGLLMEVTVPVRGKQNDECRLNCLWPMLPPMAWNHSTPNVAQPNELHSSAAIFDSFEHKHLTCGQSAYSQTQTNGSGSRCQRLLILGRFPSHLFCSIDRSNWATCLLPRCDQMAPLTCVIPGVKSATTASSIDLQWHPGGEVVESSTASTVDSVRATGFLVLLHQVGKGDTACLRVSLLRNAISRRPSWTELESKPEVSSLFRSCPTEHKKMNDVNQMPIRETFQGLDHSAKYIVSVTAFNALAQFGSTWQTQLQTELASPCAAENIQFPIIEPSALTLRWRPGPTTKCGAATHVLLEYFDVAPGKEQGDSGKSSSSRSSGMRVEFPLSRSAPDETRLASLLPCTRYCIVLFLRNTNGVSNASLVACENTKRAPLINTPRVKHNLYPLQTGGDKALGEASQMSWESRQVSCRVEVEMVDYAKTCRLDYEAQIRVLHSNDVSTSLSTQAEISLNCSLDRGIVYELRGRVLVPTSELDRSVATEATYAAVSSWSSWIPAHTGPVHTRIGNLTVTVRQPSQHLTEKGPTINYCVQPGLVSPAPKGMIVVEAGALCVELDWTVHGGLRGVLGYLVQLFASDNEARDESADAGTINTSKKQKQCLQAIWLPCSDCLSHHGLANAQDEVVHHLRQLVNSCTREGHVTGRLTLLKYLSELSRQANQPEPLLANASRIGFVVAWLPDTTDAGNASSAVRIRRAAEVHPGADYQLRRSPPREGTIVVYAATTTEVQVMQETRWQLHASPQFSGLSQRNITAMWLSMLLLTLTTAFVIALVVVLYNRRRGRIRKSVLQRVEYQETTDFEGIVHMDYRRPVLPPRSIRSMKAPDPIPVSEFIAYTERHSADNYTHVRQQFGTLRIQALHQEHAKRLTHAIGQYPENRIRNKYRNLVPFDHNYVRLLKSWRLADLCQTETSEPTPPTKNKAMGDGGLGANEDIASSPEARIESDYVNASRVTGRGPNVPFCLVSSSSRDCLSSRLPRSYIAAQAPVSHTRGIFWQMIWDNGVQLIVMLTRLSENGKEKCSAYWPDDGEARFGNCHVNLVDEIRTPVYVKRRFSLRNAACSAGTTEAARTVTQLHMLRWPDFSAPSLNDFTELLYAYWTERRCCTHSDSAVLVHCSAGVGRTGTFICLDQLCHQIRYHLQPTSEPVLHPDPSNMERLLSEEPIYANMRTSDADEATGSHRVSVEETHREAEDAPSRGGGTTAVCRPPLSTSVNSDSLTGWRGEPASRQTLLHNGCKAAATVANGLSNKSTGSLPLSQKRRISFGRRKTHSIDVYKTVLWLRANRSYMVQSEDQYIFIFRYISHFIQKMIDSEPIYENI